MDATKTDVVRDFLLQLANLLKISNCRWSSDIAAGVTSDLLFCVGEEHPECISHVLSLLMCHASAINNVSSKDYIESIDIFRLVDMCDKAIDVQATRNYLLTFLTDDNVVKLHFLALHAHLDDIIRFVFEDVHCDSTDRVRHIVLFWKLCDKIYYECRNVYQASPTRRFNNETTAKTVLWHVLDTLSRRFTSSILGDVSDDVCATPLSQCEVAASAYLIAYSLSPTTPSMLDVQKILTLSPFISQWAHVAHKDSACCDALLSVLCRIVNNDTTRNEISMLHFCTCDNVALLCLRAMSRSNDVTNSAISCVISKSTILRQSFVRQAVDVGIENIAALSSVPTLMHLIHDTLCTTYFTVPGHVVRSLNTAFVMSSDIRMTQLSFDMAAHIYDPLYSDSSAVVVWALTTTDYTAVLTRFHVLVRMSHMLSCPKLERIAVNVFGRMRSLDALSTFHSLNSILACDDKVPIGHSLRASVSALVNDTVRNILRQDYVLDVTLQYIRSIRCKLDVGPHDDELDNESRCTERDLDVGSCKCTDTHLKCPIGLGLMRHPVLCADSVTYDMENIVQWLCRNNTSPVTRQHLTGPMLYNRAVHDITLTIRRNQHNVTTQSSEC